MTRRPIGIFCVMIMLTVSSIPTAPVSASTVHRTFGSVHLDYEDCGIDAELAGLYVGPVDWKTKRVMSAAFQSAIQVKYEGGWHILSLDYDAAGHPSCTPYNTTSGGYWYHGNVFHWDISTPSPNIHNFDIDYTVEFKIKDDGTERNIRFYHKFRWSTTDGGSLTDFKAWWKFLPDVNSDTTNVVRKGLTTITTEAYIDSSSGFYEFLDSSDSSKYITVYDRDYTSGLTKKYCAFLWPPEYYYTHDENDNNENLENDRPMGSDYMAKFSTVNSDTDYASWTVWYPSWNS